MSEHEHPLLTTHRRRRRGWLAALATAVAGSTLVGMPVALAAPAPVPALVSVGAKADVGTGAVALGAVPRDGTLDVDVQLRPRDPAALDAFATDVSTPGDASFRQYLAAGTFAKRFGPTAASVRAVRTWLRTEGLTTTSRSSNGLTLHVEGTAAALERAFATPLERYRLPTGAIAFANTSAPRTPSAVARDVEGVFGLDDLAAAQPLDVNATRVGRARVSPAHGAVARATPVAATGGPQPCAAGSEAAAAKHVYAANQLATAYDLSGLYTAGDLGAGVTIALFELGPNLPSDVAAYQACFATSATVTYTKVDGGAGSGDGNGEAALDIETALGLAPRASFDVYQAPRTDTGILDDFTAMMDDDTSKVISSSWGGCESTNGSTLIAAEGVLFEQAATQGQTVLAATGDYGASDCRTKALTVDDPASQPFVTGVGGTTLSAATDPPSERAWNDSSLRTGAGGGGVSAVHVMPSYQSQAPASLHVVGADSSGAPCKAPAGSYCREVPDVSADADRSTGYLIYYDGGWSPNGGTSAATPLWAAVIALADASKACGGRTIGFANPALYSVAASEYTSVFNDVTTGNNDYTPDGNTSGLYPAGTGYDMATGLGTPKGTPLDAALCGAGGTSTATRTALRLSSARLTYGAETKEAFAVTVTGTPATGQPLGSVSVFSRTEVLCHATLTPHSDGRSTATCRLRAEELRAGRHPDLYASYRPATTSSSSATVHYAGSSSAPPRVLTVVKDVTTAAAHLAPSRVRAGAASVLHLVVVVRARGGEELPSGARASVRVGPEGCAAQLTGGRGRCSIRTSALRAGRYVVVVRFGGDADLAGVRVVGPATLLVAT